MCVKDFMARILIVEEQVKVCRSLVSILEKEGLGTCDVIGWEGVAQVCGENVYDLIIVDLDVKPSLGYEILKKINFSSLNTEIVVIAHPNTYDTARMNSYGVYDCIMRPFRLKEIVDMVKKALEKKKLVDKVRNLEQIMDMNKITFKK